jgi:hypothetical protein
MLESKFVLRRGRQVIRSAPSDRVRDTTARAARAIVSAAVEAAAVSVATKIPRFP